MTSLTGQDGLVMFSPAGTHWCLKDHTDFPAGTSITVPADADYRVGDSVVFKVENGGKLDTAITAGTTLYVVASASGTISVSATKGGTAITLNGDGGTGSVTGGVPSAITPPTLPTSGTVYGTGPYTGIATTTTTGTGTGLTVDVTVTGGNVSAIALGTAKGTGYKAGDTVTIPGASLGVTGAGGDLVVTIGTASAITPTAGVDSAGHINIAFSPVDALCGVKSWSLDLSRETVDTTTLPCKVGGAASRYASFRTSQAGFASGEGSMTVVFTSGTGMSQRLLANSMYKNSTAQVKLYVNAVSGSGGTLDDTQSNYIEAAVSLNGFSVSVNTDDVVEAEINFSLAAQPTALFGVKL
jgi:hypothetical protein